MLNDTLDIADWFKFRAGDGIYGPFINDYSQPENPLLCNVAPRVVTLQIGQHIFRWGHSGSKIESLACSPWWSTKRGAQHVLRSAEQVGASDTAPFAREASNVAKSWGSDMGMVLCARVIAPIKAFLGVGRAIYDTPFRTVWNGHENQLFIPNLGEKVGGDWVLSTDARNHLTVLWAKPASAISIADWEQAPALP